MTDLFTALDAPPARTLCRRDGPATSRAAAERIAPKINGNRALCLAVLRRLGEATQRDLDAAEPDPSPNPDFRRLAKRVGELVKMGLAEVVGERDGQQVYRAKEQS